MDSTLKIGQLLMMALLFIMYLVLLALVADMANTTLSEPIEIKNETVPIYTLSDNSLTRGHFSLGSGMISEQPMFVCYIINSDGSYSLKTLPAANSRIFMDTDVDPYILVTQYNSMAGYSYSYEIHVPKDTIIREFNLDSEI